MNELAEIISSNENQIRTEWIRDMNKSVQRPDLISKTELDEQSRTLLAAIAAGVKGGGVSDIGGPAWTAARETLQEPSIMELPDRTEGVKVFDVCKGED